MPIRIHALLRVTLLLALFLTLAPSSVRAQAPLENFDITSPRLNTLPAAPGALDIQQQQALDALANAQPGPLSVLWSSTTGAPSRINRRGRALTAPSNAPHDAIIEAFLKSNAAALNLSPEDLSETRESRGYTSAVNGVTHKTIQQQVSGIDVFGGGLRISVAPNGQVLGISGEAMPNVHSAINTTTPTLTEAEAISAAQTEAGLAALEGSTSHGLIFFPAGPGDVRLAWKVTIEDANSPNWYQSIVDASDGTVLRRVTLTHYNHIPAHGEVYLSDSPQPNTPMGTQFNDPRQDVPFNGGGDFPHDDPHYDWWGGAARSTTTSNNVDTYADRDGDNAADGGSRPTPGAGEDFTFPVDLTMEPDTY